MSERPTPEEIAYWYRDSGDIAEYVASLRAHGYRIVHPDDVPPALATDAGGVSYRSGWNACRRLIFEEAIG